LRSEIPRVVGMTNVMGGSCLLIPNVRRRIEFTSEWQYDTGSKRRNAHQGKRKRRHPTWACYHTVLDIFVQDKIEDGIVDRVVGAPFAVLVAEELFASR